MGIYYTSGGLPLPDDADPVAQGAMRIRDLGESVDAGWTPLVVSAVWVAQATYPPAYRVVAGEIHLRGSISTVAATWTGGVNSIATIPNAAGVPAALVGMPAGILNRPMVFSVAADPTQCRVGWLNVRATGQIVAYAPATPAAAIVASLDGISWAVTVVNPDPTG